MALIYNSLTFWWCKSNIYSIAVLHILTFDILQASYIYCDTLFQCPVTLAVIRGNPKDSTLYGVANLWYAVVIWIQGFCLFLFCFILGWGWGFLLYLRLAWKLLCSLGWSQTYDVPALASWLLGLQHVPSLNPAYLMYFTYKIFT